MGNTKRRYVFQSISEFTNEHRIEAIREDYRDILAKKPNLDFIDTIFLTQIQKQNNAVMKEKLAEAIPFDIDKDFGISATQLAKGKFSALSLNKLPETFSQISAHSINYSFFFLDMLMQYRKPTNSEIELFLNQLQPKEMSNVCRNRDFVAKYENSFSQVLTQSPDFMPIIIDLMWPAQSLVQNKTKPIKLKLDYEKASKCAKAFIKNADAQKDYNTLAFLAHNKTVQSLFNLEYSDIMEAKSKLASYIDNIHKSAVEAKLEFRIDDNIENPISSSYNKTENKLSWTINTALLEEWMIQDMRGFLVELLLDQKTMTWTATLSNNELCLLDFLTTSRYGEYHVDFGKNLRIHLNNIKIANLANALKQNGRKSFESLLEDYLNKVLGVRFFEGSTWEIGLPTEGNGSLKCKILIPVFEQILKTYMLYCAKGKKTSVEEVDFQYTSPDISTIMSYRQASFLCPEKSKDYMAAVNALVSYSIAFESDDGEIESFYDWLLHSQSPSLSEAQIKELEPLVQNDLVSISEGRLSLSQAQQGAIIILHHLAFGNELWLSGDNALSHPSISILSQHHLCSFSSRLFSKKESELLNYLLNDKMFTNSPAKRNTYSHGHIGTEEENRENYILMLQILCLIAIRVDLDSACQHPDSRLTNQGA